MEFSLFITNLIISITVGYICYCLVLFIDFTMNDGNIMDWYYAIIKNYVYPKHPKIAKVLGMCPICFGFWVTLFIFMWLDYYLPTNLFFYVMCIGFTEGLLINKFLK